MLGELTPDRLATLARAVAALPPHHFAVTAGDCRALVDQLAGVTAARPLLTEAA
ncbi:hypothetical protein D3C86_2237530 [compost metagenome]